MLDADREIRRDEILGDALTLSPTERPAFLLRACAEDSDLRHEVERMLGLEATLDPHFLEKTPEFPLGARKRPGQRLGRYEIEQEIGAGSAGIVYRALDTHIQRRVALKVLNQGETEKAKARFLRELRMLGSVNHDNVVQLYDGGELDGDTFLVMELLAGEDLSKAIRSGSAGDLHARLNIGRQIASGLAQVHSAGIIHRDLKPANIFLLPSGRVKLMDFGIARSGDYGLTGTGLAAGTPAYMAPEQIEGGTLTPAVDVHSFGVTLYELLTGRRAFEGKNVAVLLGEVLRNAPPMDPLRAAGVPEPFIALIRKCLEKDPSRRPADLGAAYDSALAELRTPQTAVTSTPDPPARRSQNITSYILAGVAVVAAAVIAYFTLAR